MAVGCSGCLSSSSVGPGRQAHWAIPSLPKVPPKRTTLAPANRLCKLSAPPLTSIFSSLEHRASSIDHSMQIHHRNIYLSILFISKFKQFYDRLLISYPSSRVPKCLACAHTYSTHAGTCPCGCYACWLGCDTDISASVFVFPYTNAKYLPSEFHVGNSEATRSSATFLSRLHTATVHTSISVKKLIV
jgi:hypothetical protein